MNNNVDLIYTVFFTSQEASLPRRFDNRGAHVAKTDRQVRNRGLDEAAPSQMLELRAHTAVSQVLYNIPKVRRYWPSYSKRVPRIERHISKTTIRFLGHVLQSPSQIARFSALWFLSNDTLRVRVSRKA
jgi:hypothetical protein